MNLNNNIKNLYSTFPNILVVEDDDVLQKVTPLMIKMCGYNSTLATTGQEAIRLFKKGFDLIFLDIRLPDINGFDVCKKIRALEKLNGVYKKAIVRDVYREKKKVL